jgi:ABC-type nitrate/sulfonate/bicarbonate transport system substrate-binding protein
MAGLMPLRLGLFSPSLPHLVAIREGYYEERGLTVEQQRIRSSSGLFRALRDGDVDVALTSPDNIANFRLNKVGDGPVDARIIAAVDQSGVAPAPHPGRLGPHPQCLAILRWPTAQEEV